MDSGFRFKERFGDEPKATACHSRELKASRQVHVSFRIQDYAPDREVPLRFTKYFFLGAALLTQIVIADQRVKLQDLPPAVQKSVKEQTANATLLGLSKEVENGKTMYEIETKVNGKSRDLLVDKTGAIVEVEEVVDLSGIPASAKAAIEKRAAGGTIKKVESVTHGSTVSYEAAVRTKTGKNVEVDVNADGSVHK